MHLVLTPVSKIDTCIRPAYKSLILYMHARTSLCRCTKIKMLKKKKKKKKIEREKKKKKDD